MKDGNFTPSTPFPKSEPKEKKQPQPIRKVSAKRKAEIENGLVQLKVHTPIKQSTKPIKQVSAKQAANLRAYENNKREKYDGVQVCSGCGANSGLTCSHLVARSHSFELVAEPLNHECQCHNCHELTERGQFYQLRNGLKLLERLWSSLGKAGKQRFHYVINQWPQNQNLWQHSSMLDEPCDDENNFKER